MPPWSDSSQDGDNLFDCLAGQIDRDRQADDARGDGFSHR